VLRREKEPVTDRVGARAKIDEEIKISYWSRNPSGILSVFRILIAFCVLGYACSFFPFPVSVSRLCCRAFYDYDYAISLKKKDIGRMYMYIS
jgi:hypothetical protein